MAQGNKWKETGKRFINPYNFVSLGTDVERSEPVDGELSGRIKISLIVRTPLAVPDTENVRKIEEHNIYDFYNVDGKPVIPGSQLRGMIRSAYESLSNSCFSVSNSNNILSARHANAGESGIIQFKEKKYRLFRATTSKDYGKKAIKKGEEVRRSWYDINGNNIKTKIFKKTTDEIECVNLDLAIDNYNKNIEIYKEGEFFSKYNEKSELTYGIRDDGMLYPVFYETVVQNGKTYVYLEPSQMGRFVFDNRLDDLLGTHKSCSNYTDGTLCKACALFGMISNKKSYASKLRFSDAEAVEFDSEKEVILRELMGPKITSVEFYTHRPEGALYWTYDYKIKSYKIKNKSEIKTNKEKCNVKIRGRKFYLHNPKLTKYDYSKEVKSNLNSSMELCKEGSRFSFYIYFDKITEKQLHELIWAVTIGENNADGNQLYKLGHGKPLGLGSVKLVVESVETRKFSRENMSYAIESRDVNAYVEENPFDAESKSFKEFMAITSFDGLEGIMEKEKAKISYPIAQDNKGSRNSAASHQWFTANRSMGTNGTSTAWSVKYVLPEITDENPTLPELKEL